MRNSFPRSADILSCHAEDAEAIEPEIDTSRVFGLHRRARPQMRQSPVRLCPAVRGANGALAGRTVRAAQGRWQARGSKTTSLRCSAALRPDEGDWSVQDAYGSRSRGDGGRQRAREARPSRLLGLTTSLTSPRSGEPFDSHAGQCPPKCGGRLGPASHAVRSSALCTGVRCRTSWINSRLDGMLYRRPDTVNSGVTAGHPSVGTRVEHAAAIG